MKPEKTPNGEKIKIFKELKRQVELTAETISKELKKSDDFAFRWVLWVGVVIVAANIFIGISSSAFERLTDTYSCTPEQKVIVNEAIKTCLYEYRQVELDRETQRTLREKNELDNQIAKKKLDLEALEKGLVKPGKSLDAISGQKLLATLKDSDYQVKSCTKSALKVNCKLSIIGNEQ